MFRSNRKDTPKFEDVEILGAGIVSVDVSKLIRHPKVQEQMKAVRSLKIGESPQNDGRGQGK